jgi:hypothetical protein
MVVLSPKFGSLTGFLAFVGSVIMLRLSSEGAFVLDRSAVNHEKAPAQQATTAARLGTSFHLLLGAVSRITQCAVWRKQPVLFSGC